MSIDDLPENQVDGVIQDYLDQLLVQATAEPSPILAPASKPVHSEPATVVVEKRLDPGLLHSHLEVAVEPPKIKQQSAAEILKGKVVVSSPVVKPTIVKTVEAESALTKQELPMLKNIINWRDSQGVECLIFKVGGLKLAIPLSVLGGVHAVTDKITPLFGQAKWSLGVWSGEEYKLTIIDSALLMMPERNISMRETGYQFFIQLDRSPWALACQEICDTVTLKHDSIKWRGDASKRPWLAGTVIDEMCVLLDVPEILVLLENQRRK